MNNINLIGRICRDVELRKTSSGVSVCGFPLAVDRQYKKDGEPTADFFNCVAWQKTADFIEKYMKKGLRIGVTGRLQTRNYEKEDGQKVWVTEVIVEKVYFADGQWRPWL